MPTRQPDYSPPLADGDPQARRDALYLALAQVPPGKVVTYGELAAMAGLGRAARWVGRTLGQLPDGTAPVSYTHLTLPTTPYV